MNGPVKLLAHPLHPMLVVFPLGLLSAAVIFDIVALITGNPGFYPVSYWMIAAGLIGGLLAAVIGFLDWTGISNNTRAKTIGLYHGLGNFVIVVLFAISWWLRSGAQNNMPSTLALIPSFLGFCLALVTAWLGGELVYRLGMAVEKGANENAPNSLSTPNPAPQGSRPKQMNKSGR